MVAGKGLSELLSAFALICKAYPGLYLIMIGDGALKPELIDEAEGLQISERVGFLGIRNDVQRILAAADIYVSASYSEGMSIALLEAMIAGLPIVATVVGEAPYLLADNRGVLIPSGDVDELANGFRHLLDSPLEMNRMGKAAQEYARDNCSPDIWFDRLSDVYSKAMGRQING
jgi:glycosyltransferase involved in cell wall biosynthesis